MDKVTYLQGKVDELKDPRDPPSVVLRHISEIVAERREPEWLIDDVLEQNVLAVMAGPRGTFKSFIALHWAMKVACAGYSVVILSGEGGGLDRRTDGWMRTYGQQHNLEKLPVRALERRLSLNLLDDLLALREGIGEEWPSLIILDTLSKYSAGTDLNAPKEMGSFLNGLAVQLREYYGCTVLLIAHSGHGDQKRPAGSHKLMADPDAEYIVARAADSMVVSVTRERFKDTPSLPALGYEAETVDLCRLDRRGKPVTTLVLRPTDAPSKPITVELKGKAQRQLLDALRARRTARTEPVAYTLGDLRQIARECGMHKNTARNAAEALAFTPFMVPTVGGWKLANE